MQTSDKNSLKEKSWAFLAVYLGFVVGFISAVICIKWNLVIFGFNIMYILSPLLAGVVETLIARRKYGKSTGAISALLTFILINGYGWLAPGWIFPKEEPVTLSIITLVAIALTIQAAFPIFVNHILFVVLPGILTKLLGFLVSTPSEIIQTTSPETEGEEITKADELFLDGLTIPIVSVPDVNGVKINKYFGLVGGEAIAKEKEVEGRFSKILKIIEPTRLDDMNLGEAKKVALSRMLENAESMGANAVLEVLFDFVSIGGLQGSATIVTATGTAVLSKDESNLRENASKEYSMSEKSEITNFSEATQKISSRESISEIDEKINVSVFSEKLSSDNVGEIKGESDSARIDDISNEINQFVNEESERLTKYLELAINDPYLLELEKRLIKVSRDLEEINKASKKKVISKDEK